MSQVRVLNIYNAQPHVQYAVPTPMFCVSSSDGQLFSTMPGYRRQSPIISALGLLTLSLYSRGRGPSTAAKAQLRLTARQHQNLSLSAGAEARSAFGCVALRFPKIVEVRDSPVLSLTVRSSTAHSGHLQQPTKGVVIAAKATFLARPCPVN
jgi:hypothetical protein